MQIFGTTLSQMISLFSLIALGYILVKADVVDKQAAKVLAKLENNLFIPALILETFLVNFTISNLNSAWKLLLFSLVIALLMIPVALLVGRLCEKDKHKRGTVTYGLVFSNFAFMGIALVKALFPEMELNYIIFTLPLWALIYTWATPALLIPVHGGGLRARLLALCNPMFICIVVGIALGLSPIEMPSAVMSAIGMASDCMSPVAMLLTGITIATVDIKAGFKSHSTWISCALRLVIIPLVALLIFKYLPLPSDYLVCAFCSLAMPLGLSPIVIPAAFGKDTSLAAAMALISHILSIITLPLLFMLMMRMLGLDA